MTPVYQTIKHNPEAGEFGDCHRAAIASVLNLPVDAVPHFAFDDPPSDTFFERERVFLHTHGLFAATFPMQGHSLQDVLSSFAHWNGSDFVYLLGGKSRTGVHHTVVCRGDRIVHDPSPQGAGIIAPCDDGFYWLSVFTALHVSKENVAFRLPAAHRASA